MSPTIFHRITKEARITVSGLQEAVLAVSERVTRRVQILRLHWQATNLHRQILDAHRETGMALSDLPGLLDSIDSTQLQELPVHAETQLRQSAGNIRLLQAELRTIEAAIRELEVEALHEHFIRLQQDLLTRGASILRLAIGATAPAIGQLVTNLPLPDTLRVAAVLRGPVLLPSQPPIPLRAGDIVIILGAQAELSEAIPLIAGAGRVDPVGAL
jgi:TrkA family protein